MAADPAPGDLVWAVRGMCGWPARLVALDEAQHTASIEKFDADGHLAGAEDVSLDPNGIEPPWRLIPFSAFTTIRDLRKDAYLLQSRVGGGYQLVQLAGDPPPDSVVVGVRFYVGNPPTAVFTPAPLESLVLAATVEDNIAS